MTRHRDNNSNKRVDLLYPRFLTPPEDLRSGTEFWTRSGGHSGRTIKSEKRGAFYFSADTGISTYVYVSLCVCVCVHARARACVLSVLEASRKLQENSVYGQRAVRTKLRACLANAYPWCVRETLGIALPATSHSFSDK